MGITVFEAIDPAAARTAEEANTTAEREANARAAEYAQELGGVQFYGISQYAGGFVFQGYRASPHDVMPVGWRYDKRNRAAMPDKRCPEGVVIGQKLEAVSIPDRVYPGFPIRCHIEGRALYPALELVGDKAFMVMTRDATAQEIADWDIDTTQWVQAKASAYYLAREAAEEA